MAFDGYVSIETIPGESTAAGFEDQINIRDFHVKVTQTPSTLKNVKHAQATGRAELHEIEFTKQVDSSSPQLIIACAEGRHIPKAEFSFTRAGSTQQTYYKVILTDLLITEVDQLASHEVDDDLIREQVRLYYRQAEWEYFQTDQVGGGISGSERVGWNQGANAPV